MATSVTLVANASDMNARVQKRTHTYMLT